MRSARKFHEGHHGSTDPLGLDEDLCESIIRLERHPLLDSESCQEPVHAAITLVDDLFVEVLFEHSPPGHAGRPVLAERLRSHQGVDELGPLSGLFERVDTGVLEEVLGGLRLGEVLRHIAALYEVVQFAVRPNDKVAVRNLPLVSRRQHQVLTALALIRTDDSRIFRAPLPHVPECSEHVGSHLYHDGTTLTKVDDRPHVDHALIRG